MRLLRITLPFTIVSLFIVVFAGVCNAAEPLAPSLARSEPGDSTLWYDIRNLDVEGRGWTDTKAFYDRLPSKAEGVVREPVWNLSRHSAGICVRFITDAKSISARWTLTSESLAMPHMPATGVSGLDLYVRMEYGQWRWLANGRPTEYPTNTAQLAANLPPGKREYMLYLPLYNGVSAVEIGIPKDAGLAKADSRGPGRDKPIVFYGTSITQGGCASRPGMVHTAILGRWLNYPVINLGFSGNGRMEPEMADLFAELDPSVYVLDCLPNMVADEITERVEPFVRTLRKTHPDTPILFVEDRTYPNSFLVESNKKRNTENRAAYQKAFARLVASGVRNLYYLPGEQLLSEDGEDTVDGSHPTDLGFMHQAEALYKALAPILEVDR
ncbi:SGNH/GDSL hydrolase family protein [bacterium]|nr:SGNH/GDSL hydrolase family protein [bacterium]